MPKIILESEALQGGVIVTDYQDKTTLFRSKSLEQALSVRAILEEILKALQEKGYNPVGQIVGYLMSGDPTFITSHKNARSLITQIERDLILEELVKEYLGK
ncbi:MAG: IreB family regulatory phosphoprotein [Firmicutes bacterium]|mgnify:CR=1 FL=1|nr:IreB family regulatory phosphoprotein [Bacillota bacterium]